MLIPAIDLKDGAVDAMVSAPLNKEAMHEAGYNYEGQTEILGELTSSKPAMVMVVDKMRLMLFTNHMALRAVCDHITKERMLERSLEIAESLLDCELGAAAFETAAVISQSNPILVPSRSIDVSRISPAPRASASRAHSTASRFAAVLPLRE